MPEAPASLTSLPDPYGAVPAPRIVTASGNYAFIGQPSDAVAPVVYDVTPAPGTAITRHTAISFKVRDAAPGVRLVLVTVKFAGDPKYYLVYNGSNFVFPFDTTSSVSGIGTVASPKQFSVQRKEGWPAAIEEFFVYAVDEAGNLEGLP